MGKSSSKQAGHTTPDLRRSRPSREPKVRFVLFCEGKNTEPAYFTALRKYCSNALVSLEIHGGIGVPFTIAEKAVECARGLYRARGRRPGRDSFEKNDQIWAIFDHDSHPRYEEAVNLCEQHRVQVARSNPCFELWLILHECNYGQPNDSKKVQTKLKTLRPEYDPNSGKMPDCDDLVRRVCDAERRAEAQLRHRELGDDPHGNPSTTVGRLTQAIRAASQSYQR